MARNNSRKDNKNSYEKRITQLARDLGAIDRGRKNPNSKVSDAYNQGKEPKKRDKKTLF